MKTPSLIVKIAVFALVLLQVTCQEEGSSDHVEADGQQHQPESQQGSDFEFGAIETQQNQPSDQPTGHDTTDGYEQDLQAEASSTDQQVDHQDQQMPSSGEESSTPADQFVEPEPEEPDKSGEELIAHCRSESNYQGDFKDPNESTPELKCFYACALLKMDIMTEQEGRLVFHSQEFELMLQDHFGDNSEMIDKYKEVASTCNGEVPSGGDKCEYVYDFITCGIRKLSSGRR
ncbi:Hypothetical protein NTJ_06505 [Nesidiocoris tenuis]|uniref:Uncharacterized protein n=1 Tax=Nesidiocoris tenuis TaxID=355587 RepID=A0ABN7AN95_9HEMI|nr:Hypothetical protein NTJ_06505 [Nesidiocoris tenuis]